MALYIVVHHRYDAPHDKWKANNWYDDDRIESITTTPEIAEACRKVDLVYVHRCFWNPKGRSYVGPIISCSARVGRIDGSPEKPTVHFQDAKVVGKPVKKRLYGREQPFYTAPAP